MNKRADIRATLRGGRTDWYRITNRADPATADVYIYDEIGYYGVTASDFTKEIMDLTAETIELKINSPGGEVFDGVAIYNALKDHPATVNVTIDGLAASAASFIAMAGDHIKMSRGSEMMIHEAHGMCIGNAADMTALAERLDRIGDKIANFYAERAGGDASKWRTAMHAETWYNGEEAVAAGLADEFMDAPKNDKAKKNEWDLSIFSYAGRSAAPAPAHIPPAAPAAEVIEPLVASVSEYGAFIQALMKGGHQ